LPNGPLTDQALRRSAFKEAAAHLGKGDRISRQTGRDRAERRAGR
jgi:hypothetical protein